MTFALNVAVSALVIALASWLSRRFPATAGFLIALPLATMLVLPLSYLEHGDRTTSVLLARSILVAIPVSLCFFVPFLLTGRFGLSFWQAYLYGCAALAMGYFAHRGLTRWLFSGG